MMKQSNLGIDYRAAQAAFTKIYDENVWGGGSGASSPEETWPYMKLLSSFIKSNSIESVVDVGCGDWQFSRYIDWNGVAYSGFDVVDSVIENNSRQFGGGKILFSRLTSLQDLPTGDLVVCKDVLQHLPNNEVLEYLNYFRVNYKFALITNDGSAFDIRDGIHEAVSDHYINLDIHHGSWRLIRPN